METITGRNSRKPANQAVEEGQRASQPGELGGTLIGTELVREPESSSKFGWEDAKEAEPRTTWVWDREKEAWVETMEKPTVEELSRANGSATTGPIVLRQPSATPASVTRKIRWPKSAWNLLATRSSSMRVIDALALKSKAPEPFGAEAAVCERTENEATGIICKARQEAEELPIVIIGTIEEQAQNALSKANDKAQEIKEKAEREALIAKQEAQKSSLDRISGVEQQGRGIIKTVEEKAEAKAEDIIARAEENARAQAEKIITQAEAKAEDIIARAEENARAQAERIIAQVEEKAKEQAETVAAEAKAACQEAVSAAEHQAQHILKTAKEKARESKAPAETTAEAVPEQLERCREEDDQKERPVSYEGTAELVIGPPVDLGKTEKVLNRLTKSDQIRVLDLEGSMGKGIKVKLFSRNIARLPNVLVALPEVEKVSDLPRKVGKICPGQWICPGLRKGNEPPARRLLVTMEKPTTYTEI